MAGKHLCRAYIPQNSVALFCWVLCCSGCSLIASELAMLVGAIASHIKMSEHAVGLKMRPFANQLPILLSTTHALIECGQMKAKIP